ncbi:tetratricopeptide repeat protein [Nocardia sp. BMG111209]|uniref:tetratricopeptide repeat protein n=1 Tax=Nocardia sp. BMG111209 TaxID=1160137 RepID=UPI0003716FBD|nr:tetratricopeptide repeat protein [Nocardia sp. BMG111209]
MTRPSTIGTYDEPALAARYAGADPVDWHGATVHPLYSEALGTDPVVVDLALHESSPPPGLLGLGIGLSVIGGHVALGERRLLGVDVWSDAIAAGISLDVCAASPEAAITLTPVWMEAGGEVMSWTGNYGVLIDRTSTGNPLLRCSIGVGPVSFADLVVEVAVRIVPTGESRYRGALYELGVAMHGRGDLDQACELWTQAAARGHAGAAYDLGVLRYRRGELREAEHWWRVAADHGDVRAMAGLAAILRRQGNLAEAQAWRDHAGGI